jgi:hypothetical protein
MKGEMVSWEGKSCIPNFTTCKKKPSKLPCATRVRTLRQIKKPFIVLADLLDNQGITLIPRFDAGMYFYCPNPNCHPHTPRYTPYFGGTS